MNMERTVSRVRPATDTPPTVRSDLDIIAAVADAVTPGLMDEPPVDPESVYEEFVGLTAGTLADCSGITYERLDHETAVRWPAPDPDSSGGYRYYDPDAVEASADVEPGAVADGGTAAGEEGWTFATPDGRALFSASGDPDVDLPEPADETYPLTVTTAREPSGYNTGIRSRSVDDPGPIPARVNPDTVASHATQADGELVRIETRRAGVEARVDPDPAVPEGTVWLPIHHPMTNDLTIPAVDPQSAEPNLKQCAARIVADGSSESEPEEATE
jgi:assimilatory nitrate reductase catalytic subunit